jgi:DNA-binding LacI/PurR family transcriptional regulator
MASSPEAQPVVVETNFSAADGARVTAELPAREAAPTAIIYANDAMAIACLGAARPGGLDVPCDLSIVGFDDSAIGRYIELSPARLVIRPSTATGP